MANVLDIRRRIRSVINTRQITKAMKTVSAAKLRRAQEACAGRASVRADAHERSEVAGRARRHLRSDTGRAAPSAACRASRRTTFC